MARNKLTESQKKYILDNYKSKAAVSIQRELGISKSAIANFYRKHSLRSPKELSIQARALKMTGRTILTPEEDQFIKANYLTIPIKTMADKMGRCDSLIRTRVRQLNLIIPEEIIEQRKKASQIQKGSTPPNKGKRMPLHVYEKAKLTMFKKGNVPPNTKHDGYISIRLDNQGHPYKHIRLSKGQFELLHRKIWADANGSVPEGMVITFINGDSLDCRLENLKLISREENMRRNSIHNYPEDIVKTVQTIAVLNRQINKRTKQK